MHGKWLQFDERMIIVKDHFYKEGKFKNKHSGKKHDFITFCMNPASGITMKWIRGLVKNTNLT